MVVMFDLLFLNAGGGGFAPFEQTDEAVYDKVLALNTKAPYFAAQKLVLLMPQGSAIVLTTSAANLKGLTWYSAYEAAKAALRSLSQPNCCRAASASTPSARPQ